MCGQRLDVQLTDAEAFATTQAYLGRRAIHVDQATLTLGVASDGDAADVRALLDELDPQCRIIGRFGLHAASLDDVFLSLTGNDTAKETAHV